MDSNVFYVKSIKDVAGLRFFNRMMSFSQGKVVAVRKITGFYPR